MSEDLRLRLQRKREEGRARHLQESLSEVGFLDFVELSLPDWIERAIADCLSISSKPDARIDAQADDSELDRWAVDFARKAGLVTRFYCRTDLQFFPWAEISTSQFNWPGKLRSSIGRDLVLVSHNKETLVVFFEEEYEIIAFRYSDGSNVQPNP